MRSSGIDISAFTHSRALKQIRGICIDERAQSNSPSLLTTRRRAQSRKYGSAVLVFSGFRGICLTSMSRSRDPVASPEIGTGAVRQAVS